MPKTGYFPVITSTITTYGNFLQKPAGNKDKHTCKFKLWVRA